MSNDEEHTEESSAADEPDSSEDEGPGISEGDVIKLDYTAYSVESDQLVDTTDPDVAEDEGVADEDQTFEPQVIAVGEGMLFEPVEDALIGLEAGDTATVTVPAEDAFGDEDPDQVRTVSADRIPEDDRYPGAHVELDGQHGFVETVIGGRARVDFNHPLAGEAIEYELEVLEILEDREELAHGLLGTYIDEELDIWFETEELEEEDDEGEVTTSTTESLYIEATPALTMNQQWMFRKQEIASQLIEQLGIDRVVVQEILESRDQVIEDTQALLEGEGLEDVEDVEDLEEAVDVEES